jgi:hypothetical protein
MLGPLLRGFFNCYLEGGNKSRFEGREASLQAQEPCLYLCHLSMGETSHLTFSIAGPDNP